MIHLRDMQIGEFPDFIAYFIPDYAEEISANYDEDIDETDSPVGSLWCKPEETGKTVFISEFYVLPGHRGKGYAKSALIALEDMFARTGHREARLRVAADNEKAQRLYLAAGYRTTGINMRKSFGG